MKVKSTVKSGALVDNHSQKVKGLRVKSGVKAGDTSIDEGDGVKLNHSQSVTR